MASFIPLFLSCRFFFNAEIFVSPVAHQFHWTPLVCCFLSRLWQDKESLREETGEAEICFLFIYIDLIEEQHQNIP